MIKQIKDILIKVGDCDKLEGTTRQWSFMCSRRVTRFRRLEIQKTWRQSESPHPLDKKWAAAFCWREFHAAQALGRRAVAQGHGRSCAPQVVAALVKNSSKQRIRHKQIRGRREQRDSLDFSSFGGQKDSFSRCTRSTKMTGGDGD